MQYHHKFLIAGMAIGSSNLGHAVQAAMPSVVRSSPPIIRTTGTVPQQPSCFIEMPNQAMQNLDGLCQIGKPKTKTRKLLDITTDLNKDGIPDELAAEFRKMDALIENPASSPAESIAQQRQMWRNMMDMNERMPYAESTKAAMREMGQLAEANFQANNSQGAGSEAQWQRMSELGRRMDQDPVFRQVQEYSNRFQTQKWERRSRNR
jgi:hypothetical protein